MTRLYSAAMGVAVLVWGAAALTGGSAQAARQAAGQPPGDSRIP